MQKTYELTSSLPEDLDRLKTQIERFKRGEISHTEFRAFRVPQGVYEQRDENHFMLRVRLPGGGLLPDQMRALAAVSRRHGNGILHVTTRQDVQVHLVPLEHMHPALVELAAEGLSTKGGGGNTVRNITAGYDSGVCPDELFDVAPYAVALTEFMLEDPASYRMPRKYKIAFSGCRHDTVGGRVNDLGCYARVRDGARGFAVYAGGGMGARSAVGELLEEFVPAGRIHYVAEAVKRVFNKHGNRKNKDRARLRFLIEKIGFDRFRRLYEAEFEALDEEGLSELNLRELPGGVPVAEPPAEPEPAGEGFDLWRRRNVAPQKQAGYHMVHVPLTLGDARAETFEKLADVLEEHGEGAARTTQWQNLLLRWVHENELPALHRELASVGLADARPAMLRDMIACAGASTCKLGICLSRGLAEALLRELGEDGPDLEGLQKVKLHISGCPNACGRHPVGGIGLFGAARRVDDRLVPHYVVQLGGRHGEQATRLAEGRHSVPARNVPALLADLLRAFQRSAHYPDYDAFVDTEAETVIEELAERYRHVPPFTEDRNYYYDWTAEELFSLAGRGPGECGAGVFDLIEVDLQSAAEALEQGRLFQATALAARALLITRGHEARGDAEALRLFRENFVKGGFVREPGGDLLARALHAADEPAPSAAFEAERAEVAALVEAVQGLYDRMDTSLRLVRPEEEGAPKAQTPADAPDEEAPRQEADREADFRGVACPLNYVKTKMTLARMQPSQVLSVLLDREGARNVPESAARDGHEVLDVAEEDDHWRGLIRKA